MDVTGDTPGPQAPRKSALGRELSREGAMHYMTEQEAACIEACNVCAIDCASCFAQMVGQESHNDCPACCVECAEACRWCADAIARRSPFAQQVRELCAAICDWCAEQCAMHDMAHCQRCAESCRRCASACRAQTAASKVTVSQ